MHYKTVGKYDIGAPCKIIIGALLNCLFFQYCDSNIGLICNALNVVIIFPDMRKQKLLLLISLLFY